jgi:hypothetical protein
LVRAFRYTECGGRRVLERPRIFSSRIAAAALTALVAALGVAARGAAARDAPVDQEGIAFFEAHVRPLLAARCYECHSSEAKELRGGLRLDTRSGVLAGGESGPVVVPLRPEESRLLAAVRGELGDLVMPPAGKKRLSGDEIQKLDAWIKMGAPDPRSGERATRPARIDMERSRAEWPFTPITDPAPPPVEDAGWPLTPVDRFVLARLEAEGLEPVAEAGRRVLIRRLTFDLTGLPPEPEEIEAFLGDDAPDAFERLVDRLLASPGYGERWGRHWLDVVRYADTAGDNSDYPVPQLYLYRNYVIDSFNEDVPYDRFIEEQIAGDLLEAAGEDDRRRNAVATGYLALSRRFGSRVDDYPWHLTIEDTLDNLGRAFLGLTVNCARCHDHKFDPVTSEDYYALYAFFESTRYPWPGIELDKVQRDLVPLVPQAEIDALAAAAAERRGQLAANVKRLEEEVEAAGKDKERASGARKRLEAAKKSAEAFEKRPLTYPAAYAVAEGKRAGNARVQVRGQPHDLGREVPRRFLEVLGGEELPAAASGSGRRILAGWLKSRANPLTARVLVNRLWAHHFARGLVPTPNNFGKQGEPPSHPELLDYLAARFIESGWSIKAMHRLLLSSRVYRLASCEDERSAARDPASRLLSRHARRRLEAEAVRDALLAVSSGLDRSMAREPHPFPAPETWDFTQHKPFRAVYETSRRSVYVMSQRIAAHPFFGIFDGPDPNASTGVRPTSTSPLQALWLLNNPLFEEAARGFAARVLREAVGGDEERIARAYVLALGRPPTAEERAEGGRHLEAARAALGGGAQTTAAETGAAETGAAETGPSEIAAWESLARVLLRTNEFIYVE